MAPEQIKKQSSYVFGFQNGRQFAQQVGQYGLSDSDVDSAEFMRGFLSGMKEGKPELTDEQIQATMMALQGMVEKREKDMGAKNLTDGKAFLEGNGKRKEVTTTASGLQYEVITKGGDKKYDAAKDGENKQFMVKYRGTLIDGKEFDKSPEGETVPMSLQVIPGFKEAITTMPIGAKWKLFIPSALAYGEERRGADIAPNSALVFELELVGIEDAPPPQTPGGGFPMPAPGQGQGQ
jgi:FKBP-type peptidyl-prolyl cis-trans isomerase